MKKMPPLYVKDLLNTEWLMRKICRWLDGDVRGNVRRALAANDLGKALWEYQDQQDHALVQIREIDTTGCSRHSKKCRDKVALRKFVDSLAATMVAIRGAYQEQENARKVPTL